MSNTVQQFLNETFGEVRAFNDNKGNIWFVAQDVAKVLEYTNTQKVTQKVDDEDMIKIPQSELPNLVITNSKAREDMIFINESGLYQVVSSVTKKDEVRYSKSKDFKRWITGVVIPALRKDGAYIDGEEKVVTGEMSEDEFILKAINILQSKVERLTKERDELKDEVEQFTGTDNLLEWNTVAKNLKIGRNTMLQKLRDMKILQTDVYTYNGKEYNGESHNVPYQSVMKYFDVKHIVKNGRRYPKVMVTAKGQEWLYKKLVKVAS